MKKKRKLFLCLIVLTPVFLIAAGYIALAFYYHDEFFYGTWLNGVYCTGRSVEEVNELLTEKTPAEDIVIVDMAGNTEYLHAEDIQYQVDYREHLNSYLSVQNPFLWGINLFRKLDGQILPAASYDEEKLLEKIEGLAVVRQGKTAGPARVEIVRTAQGYVLEETLSRVPDAEKITDEIIRAVSQGEHQIELTEEFYENREMTEEMKETLILWDKVAEFQDCGIIYDMGDELIPIDASVTADWIAVTDEGDFILDEEGCLTMTENGIADFIDALAEEYDTYNVPREFLSTRGDLITIEKGTYGNQLNRKAEKEYLLQAFELKKKETHIPTYSKEALYRGRNDIGSTYIEVDMTEQTMYYYVDGEQQIMTPIVTGNLNQKNGTPSRVCAVYAKQTDRILRGPGYESPVKYWVPVYGNIGIHDASWRSQFGGSIYKTNGSHGCINTPYDAMEQLYEAVEIGTPVIMFY